MRPVESFNRSLVTYFKHVLMLGKHVDKSDLSWLHCERANHIAVNVFPPGYSEADLAEIGIWLHWHHVQVRPLWAVNCGDVLLWVNESFGL